MSLDGSWRFCSCATGPASKEAGLSFVVWTSREARVCGLSRRRGDKSLLIGKTGKSFPGAVNETGVGGGVGRGDSGGRARAGRRQQADQGQVRRQVQAAGSRPPDAEYLSDGVRSSRRIILAAASGLPDQSDAGRSAQADHGDGDDHLSQQLAACTELCLASARPEHLQAGFGLAAHGAAADAGSRRRCAVDRAAAADAILCGNAARVRDPVGDGRWQRGASPYCERHDDAD